MPFYMIKLKGWAAVFRDTIIFILITIVGFFAVPVIFGPDPSRDILLIYNILLGIIAFCISGCLVADGRWRHLNKLAIILCLIISIIVIISMLTPLKLDFWKSIILIAFNILIIVIGVYIMMALGGSLSFVFIKAENENRNKDDTKSGTSSR